MCLEIKLLTFEIRLIMIRPSNKNLKKLNPNLSDRNLLTNEQIDQRGYGLSGYFLITLSVILLLITLPVSICCSLQVIKEYQRAVVFRLGKIHNGRAKGPGILFTLPCIDQVIIADMRTQTFEVPPQEVTIFN